MCGVSTFQPRGGRIVCSLAMWLQPSVLAGLLCPRGPASAPSLTPFSLLPLLCGGVGARAVGVRVHALLTLPTRGPWRLKPPPCLGHRHGPHRGPWGGILLPSAPVSSAVRPRLHLRARPRGPSGLRPALAAAAPAACKSFLMSLPLRSQPILHAGTAIIFLKCRLLPVTAPPKPS